MLDEGAAADAQEAAIVTEYNDLRKFSQELVSCSLDELAHSRIVELEISLSNLVLPCDLNGKSCPLTFSNRTQWLRIWQTSPLSTLVSPQS